MKTATRFASIVVGISLSLASLGCGSAPEDQPDLGQVSGTVTMNGKPLANVLVTFTPEVGRPSVGTTDTEGHYELNYIRDINGAVIGHHDVRITTVHETASDKGDGKPPKETIPAIYNVKTTLQKEVTAGENTIDFPLKP